MKFKIIVLTLFFLFSFCLSPKAYGFLTCSSPKKGAVGVPVINNLGISNFYRYWPFSGRQDTTPMLKRGHIDRLKVYQDTLACNLAGCTMDNAVPQNCCPAKMIQDTINARGRGGYWLIFNEPFTEDEYGECPSTIWPCFTKRAADDAAFAISFIKRLDPSAKFIVGWFSHKENGIFYDIIDRWPSVIDAHPEYGLNRNINQVIAGWSLHYVDRPEIESHPLLTKSPGKEIWITELGTLSGTDCRYDNIDTDPNQRCVRYMTDLVNWLENTNYVTKYFWWNYGLCDGPDCVDCGQDCGYKEDQCWGTLTKLNPPNDADYVCDTNFNGQTVSLNNLGLALAAIPNVNGVCRYPLTTPTATVTPRPTTRPSPTLTPTPTPFSCPQGYKGNLNCDLKINELDLTILLSSWGPVPSPQPGHWLADLNGSGAVDITDLNILLNYWEVSN